LLAQLEAKADSLLIVGGNDIDSLKELVSVFTGNPVSFKSPISEISEALKNDG